MPFWFCQDLLTQLIESQMKRDKLESEGKQNIKEVKVRIQHLLQLSATKDVVICSTYVHSQNINELCVCSDYPSQK